jgi:hypothetical protein
MAGKKIYNHELDSLLTGFLEYVDIARECYSGVGFEALEDLRKDNDEFKWYFKREDDFYILYYFSSVIKDLMYLKKLGIKSEDFDEVYNQLNSVLADVNLMTCLHRFDNACKGLFMDNAIPHYFVGYIPDMDFCKLGFNWFDKYIYAKKNEYADDNSDDWYIDSRPSYTMGDLQKKKKKK